MDEVAVKHVVQQDPTSWYPGLVQTPLLWENFLVPKKEERITDSSSRGQRT